MQVVVSIVGILLMTVLAYYRSWSKNADKAPAKIKPIVAGRLSGGNCLPQPEKGRSRSTVVTKASGSGVTARFHRPGLSPTICLNARVNAA
jgi:hypothetical protein